MSKREKGKAPAVEAPALAKAESSKPAAATAAPAKAAPGKFTPMMSAAVRLPPEPPASVRRPTESMTSAGHEFADKSDAGFITRSANAEELKRFRGEVEARRERESAAEPVNTFWTCPRCHRQDRRPADVRTSVCFFCNPRLLPSGQQMTQVVDEAGIAAFLEREAADKVRWRASLDRALVLKKKMDRERGLLRRHGL